MASFGFKAERRGDSAITPSRENLFLVKKRSLETPVPSAESPKKESRSASFKLDRKNNTLKFGKEVFDLTLDGQPPKYPVLPGAFFSFAFGDNQFTLYKKEGKMFARSTIAGTQVEYPARTNVQLAAALREFKLSVDNSLKGQDFGSEKKSNDSVDDYSVAAGVEDDESIKIDSSVLSALTPVPAESRAVDSAAQKSKESKKPWRIEGTMLRIGDKELDLSTVHAKGNPELSTSGRPLKVLPKNGAEFAFAYGDSSFALFKKGDRYTAKVTMLGNVQPEKELTLEGIFGAVENFKLNVHLNDQRQENLFYIRNEGTMDASGQARSRDSVFSDFDDVVTPVRAGETARRRMVDVVPQKAHGKELHFDTSDSADQFSDITPEDKARINETLENLPKPLGTDEVAFETATATEQEKKTIQDLVAELVADGKDEDYYAGFELSNDYPTENETLEVASPAAAVYSITSAGGEGCKYKHKEKKGEQENQDAAVAVVTEKGRLGAAVIDVAGTSKNGLMVQRIVQDTMLHALKDDRISAETGILAADKRVVEIAKAGAYACVVAATVEKNGSVEIASWGDSKAVTVRDGAVVREGTTELHNLASMFIKKENVSRAESEKLYFDHGFNMVVRGFVGAPSKGSDKDFKKPDVLRFQAKNSDQIILASDGLWDVASEYEVEQLCQVYRGEKLQQALFELAFKRNNSKEPYMIEVGPGDSIERPPKFGQGDNITIQVIEVTLESEAAAAPVKKETESQGFLARLGKSKVGKWLRTVALVGLGLSGTSGKEEAPAPQQKASVVHMQLPAEGSADRGKITIEKKRNNEHALVRLVNERNKELHFMGLTLNGISETSLDDKGRIVFIAALTKDLLRGHDVAGFKAKEFNKNIQQNADGTWQVKDQGVFDAFLRKAAGVAQEKVHISTVKKYAAGTYAKDLE